MAFLDIFSVKEHFIRGGSSRKKKGIWGPAPEAIGVCMLKTKIIHNARFVHNNYVLNQVSVHVAISYAE